MKSFSPEQIEKFRNDFRAAQYPEVPVDHRERTYRYFVLPSKLGPKELPNFVFRATPPTERIRASETPEEDAVFAVSEDVREKFRCFAVTHEIEEFMHIGIETGGRCASAAETEVSMLRADEQLTEDEKAEYLRMRVQFFRDLIPYALARGDSYTPEDLEEFRGSLAVFERANVRDA
ncbi:MAG: hypothetical protein PHE68_05235 [Candidatus Peribacteraceae bacterium]|nr:hypothetical protein [Candidatus Peribacteraceae bacterium]